MRDRNERWPARCRSGRPRGDIRSAGIYWFRGIEELSCDCTKMMTSGPQPRKAAGRCFECGSGAPSRRGAKAAEQHSPTPGPTTSTQWKSAPAPALNASAHPPHPTDKTSSTPHHKTSIAPTESIERPPMSS